LRRRGFIALIGAGVTVAALAKPGATQPSQPFRVGMATIAPRSSPFFAAFIERMAEFGYVEGKNFILEHVPVQNSDGYARCGSGGAGDRCSALLLIFRLEMTTMTI